MNNSDSSISLDIDKNGSMEIPNYLIKVATYFIIIDILFFPYFPYFIMPISLPLVFLLTLFKVKIKNDIYWKSFLILSLSIIAGTLFSNFLGRPSSIVLENVKRAFQFITSFSYYFYFRWAWEKHKFDFKKILVLFIVYQFVLGLLFFIDPQYIVSLKEVVYTASERASVNVVFFLRYSYIFVDPNTAAYFYLMVVFYLFSNTKLTYIEKGFIFVSTIILLFAFMSTGAFITVVIGIFMYLFFYNNNIPQENIKFVMTFLLTSTVFIFISRYLQTDLWHTILEVIDRYKDRLEISSGPSRFGRLRIYIRALTNFYPFIFGQGYTLLLEGETFAPHSDHLRVLYGYGLIAYVNIVLFFFKNIFASKFAFIVPAFMAFSINTLIDEQKLLVLFLIFLAICKTKRETPVVDKQ